MNATGYSGKLWGAKRDVALWRSVRIRTVLAWFVLSQSAWATSSADAYTVRRWGVEDGLPESVVTAVCQFPDGFLWLTTPRHVVRFDGVSFVPYPQKAYPARRPQRFNSILCDRLGRMWVAGEDGVMRRDGTEWTSVPLMGDVRLNPGDVWRVVTPDGTIDQSPRLMLFWIKERPGGSVWVASNAGMFCFDGQVFRLVPWGDTTVAGAFLSAAMDARGTVWLAGKNGLLAFDGKTYAPSAHPSAAKKGTWFQVFSGLDNALWCKLQGGRMFRRPDGNGAWEEIGPAGLRHAALLERPGGEAWYGAAEGIYLPNQTNWIVLAGSGIDKAHDVRCFEEASDGSIWAGTGNGLFQISPRGVRIFTAGDASSRQTVTALLPDGVGGFWAGVDGCGLLRGDAGHFVSFLPCHRVLGVDGATVSALCLAPDALWVGTRADHLWQVTPDGKTHQVRSLNGYASRDITALALSNEGRLWAGTREGLFSLQSVTQGLAAAEAPSDAILCLCADPKGGVWVGAQTSGLWRIADVGGTQTAVRIDGLPSDTVRALHVDEDGWLWIATPKGLAYLQEASACGFPSIRTFTGAQGLPAEDIWQLLDDGAGNLWLGTRQRILRLKKAELLTGTGGGERTLFSVRTFSGGQGLTGKLSGGDHDGPLAVRTGDGRLWFATHAGLAMIDPAELTDTSAFPSVVIETLSARAKRGVVLHQLSKRSSAEGGRRGESPAGMALPAGCRDVVIRFTAPLFTDPEQVLFRTRLEGFDTEWTLPLAERQAVYPQLPHGRYRFCVATCYPDGGWRISPETVSFAVLPFFWQTAWFETFAGLAALGASGALAGFFVKRREAHKLAKARRQALELEREMARDQAIQRERARIARDIHDDLGAGLTQMALLSELGQGEIRMPEKLQTRMDQIFRTASGLAKGLNEIVWAVNPQNDTLASMLSYLESYADEYLRSAGLRFRIDVPQEYPARPVASVLRHHLFCAIREALNNAIKHAGASEVRIGVALAGQSLTLCVSDNGRGFDPAALPTRTGRYNGLANMRRRMEEVGGAFEIDSVPGRGTRLQFRVSLAADTRRPTG